MPHLGPGLGAQSVRQYRFANVFLRTARRTEVAHLSRKKSGICYYQTKPAVQIRVLGRALNKRILAKLEAVGKISTLGVYGLARRLRRGLGSAAGGLEKCAKGDKPLPIP